MGGSVLILLDTHIWIWLNAAPELLEPGIANKLSQEGLDIGLSAVSVWEVITAVQKGRLGLVLSPEQAVEAWINGNDIQVIPLDKEIAILSRTLQFAHEEPADRFIAATSGRTQMSKYLIVIEREGDKWAPSHRTFRGWAWRLLREEVERLAREAVESHVNLLRELGEPVPEPTAEVSYVAVA